MFDAPTFAEPVIQGNGDVRAVAYGNDAGVFVEFRMEQVYQEFKSLAEGHPIYEAVPFIRIYVPGDKTKVVDRPVKLEQSGDVPSDPQRFPMQWQAFKSGVQATAAGKPLAEWPLMTTSQVKELNAINIYTVEALAEVSDAALDGLGHGGRSLRDQAKAHVEQMKDGAATAKLVAANADLQRQIDELRASLTSPDDKRGAGRPRKEDSNGE